ncbi:hypothetical protein BDR07DRAFT_1380723 [Suillus spraguei]|nr:hypothetical protein BDR07DRAFT_1380723 [Suillus spraguei]
MCCGHPPKPTQQRNITGLRNQLHAAAQQQHASSSSDSDDVSESLSKKMKPTHPSSRSHSPSLQVHPPIMFDSLKMVSNCDDNQSDIESDAEEISDTYLNDSGLCSCLIDLAASIDDDLHDETWLPPREAKQAAQQVQHHSFTKRVWMLAAILPKPSNPQSAPIPPAHPTILVPLVSESLMGFKVGFVGGVIGLTANIFHAEFKYIAVVVVKFEHIDLDSEDAEPTPELSMSLASNMNVEEMWEDELQEQEQSGVKVQGWSELREQIKEDL